ncbi:MAG: response regulator [Kastovskya adunca ATA6-11-RM4]|jgi:signal transduction histidine kinase|nr:response regulator [Kastovskya adunca ATA6-11-RM4]
MESARILIVEDERIVAKDIERSLEELGYTVVASVASAETAIQKAREDQIDLILMDIYLQGDMDGIEAAEQIKYISDIPIVYLTANADENTLQRAKITEPFGYILKPFDERDLQTTIEIALRRHLAEAATRIALEKAQQVSEIQSRFWSMVVHEFRNPLTAISSAAELLENHSHELSEIRRREYLYLIQTSVYSVNELLNEVLNFARAESGKLECKLEKFDLEEFCRNLVEELQFSAGHKHQIILNIHGDCTDVCLDRKLIRHILSNLLVNALKYSPHVANIYFDLHCENGETIFKVKDKGIGIPPADKKRLFESFHRATNVGDIPGHGLGLTMVKKCLDLHNGKITVESEPGVGTTFTVTLPLFNCVFI